jgi:dipeptidyl aminopeptidase/acylaminoacyl peptidase
VTLPAGTRLGSYEIVALLGAGGMGEVYRARDTKLGRDVAIKILPAETALDPERRRRFEQEAHSASALNHPNIVTIHDIGSADSTFFIAMEMVDGRTVRELMTATPLPAKKVLDIAVQIADGLAKAHVAGIVHRDLKPENVMVSRDGFVKILDFGLAKLVASHAAGSDLPTMAKPGTRPGTVMGTVGYMSPEQASGQAVDFRSDQFSLGAILYEMATAKRAFQRKTGAETLAAIIRDEPPAIASINPRAPAPLRWIVERCLAKEPEERYVSTKDLARDLSSVRDHLSETSVSGEPLAAARRPRVRAPVAAGLVLAALAGSGLGFVLGKRAAKPEAALRFTRLTFRRGTVLSARFAPDGRTVIYGAAWEGKPVEVFSTQPGAPESRSLDLPAADILSVSNKGEMAISIGRRFNIGWETSGTLARVPLSGGAPREVMENVQEADWSPDGTSFAVVRDAGDRRRLEFPPGKVLHESSGWISHARVSPDAARVAFVDHPTRGDNVGTVTVVDLSGSRKTFRASGANGLAWSAAGELWVAAGGIIAVPLAGDPRVMFRAPGVTHLHDVADGGRILANWTSWRREIVSATPGETRERNLSWLDWSYPVDLSADGKTVLFDEQQQLTAAGEYGIYIRRTDGSPAVRLGDGHALGLSPDGKWALAVVGNSASGHLALLPTGAGEARALPKSGLVYETGTWFSDGTRILLSASEPGHGSRLYVQEIPDGLPKAISAEGVVMDNGRAVSPDGTRVVAKGPDGRIAVYPIGGGEPLSVPAVSSQDRPIGWAPDGLGIYVVNGTTLPARVDLVEAATGRRRPWKEITPSDPAGVLAVHPVLLTPDGKSYVYSYRRVLDDLFLVEGLK